MSELDEKKRLRLALTGGVGLEMLTSYFRDAGYDVMPQDVTLDAFKPDFVLDVTDHDAALAEETANFRDERMMKLAGCPYSVDGIRAIVEEFSWRVVSSALSSVKKILAVDADDTLWRGVLGEEGPRGVLPCTVLQDGLKALRADGVLLVLLSKNEPEDVELMLDATRPSSSPDERILTRSDFDDVKANWEEKAENLVTVCRALNLAPDAVVYVDDNANERAQMASRLPGVTVAPWTGWKTASEPEQRQLVRRLREYFFPTAGRTDEDRLRAHDYAAQRQRLDLSRQFASRDEYLDSLGLWVRPSLASEDDLDRLAQMAAKTNQFNATTIRRTREEFESLLHSDVQRVYVFRAGDRFGEQGLVAYVIVNAAEARITDFVMSCRAMGRTLEYFILDYVQEKVGHPCAIDFTPTQRNRPFADFLAVRDADVSTRHWSN